MNLSKKLAKYARKLDNPKYYYKIQDILEKAEKIGFNLEDFNYMDIAKIQETIGEYFEQIDNKAAHKRIVKYYNSYWFIVSDKKYVLFTTATLFSAIWIYLRCSFILHLAKLQQPFMLDRIIMADNVNKDIYLFKGGIRTSRFIGCDVLELEENRILK